MKRQLFSFLLLVTLAISISAQSEKPILVDEFGVTNCDDYRGRIDILLNELKANSGSSGLVIVYDGDLELQKYDKNGKVVEVRYERSEVGLASELIRYYKNHLLFRYFDLNRVDLVYGGFRSKLTTSLWVVPKGANRPEPTPSLTKLKQRKKKYDPEGFCSQP